MKPDPLTARTASEPPSNDAKSKKRLARLANETFSVIKI